MTLIFFFLALLFGWMAYNLYYPHFTNPKLSTVSFLSGWLVGELAIHHIIWQSLLVFFFVWGGAVSGFFGGLGFLICTGAWLAMAYFYVASHAAEDEIELSLQQGLGSDYRDYINQSFVKEFPDTLDFRKIRNPRHIISSQVETIKDVPYGNFDQKLDIYRSKETADKRPVLLQIHGGAWTEKMGSKNEQALPLMNHMALRNWICVSISYRLSPTATFPAHIIDCKEALVWIKKHIGEYGGDPDFIVVTGGSAGGHLSSLVALSANDPDFQPGFETEDTTVQGAVPFYGVYDFTDAEGLHRNDGLLGMAETSIFKRSMQEHLDFYKSASPLFRITHKAPPFLIIQGDKDTLVPVETATAFAEKLREISDSSVVYTVISGGQHAFDMFPSIRSEHVKHGVERYLGWLYSGYLNTALVSDHVEPDAVETTETAENE